MKLLKVRCGVKVFYRLIPSNACRTVRGQYLEQDRSQTLDWDTLRERVKNGGHA